jgi:hypothetical protein
MQCVGFTLIAPNYPFSRDLPMNPCPSAEQLQRMLADALTTPDAEAVEAHVAACASCQQVLERLAARDAVPRPAASEPATQPAAVPDHDEAFLRQVAAAPPWVRPASPQAPPASRDVLDSEVGPVRELLLRWEQLRARGEQVSAQELCRDHPEWVAEVSRCIHILEAGGGANEPAASRM